MLAGLSAATAACTVTPNGTTFSGSNVNRAVTLSGGAVEAGATIRVQVLEKASADPNEKQWSASTWTTIATGQAGSTPYDYNSATWYTFGVSAKPINTALGDPVNRWLPGGLVKLRVQEFLPTYGTWSTTFTFDDVNCLVEKANNGQDWVTVSHACASHSNPELTFVDVDRAGFNWAAQSNYLSFKSNPLAEATQYYNAINAPATLNAWRAQYFNAGSAISSAAYYNAGDLGFGRHMRCRTNGGGGAELSCYVQNYGNTEDLDADRVSALADMVNHLEGTGGAPPGATVAMVYDANASSNEVRFYVYNGAGVLATEADLDSGPAHAVPGICINCHGGTHDFGTNAVTGAKFLPFDVFTFAYSSHPSYTRTAQEESFRKLNAMVYGSGPTQAIKDVIDGLYGNHVTQPNAVAVDTWVPGGWSGHETLYRELVKPYCRTCHISRSNAAIDWDTWAEFSTNANVKNFVCQKAMPQAQLTAKNFYESGARAHLTGELGYPDDCPL